MFIIILNLFTILKPTQKTLQLILQITTNWNKLLVCSVLSILLISLLITGHVVVRGGIYQARDLNLKIINLVK